MNKINYDNYFLSIAHVVAQRSIDPSTKCGAVLVSADHRILSTGYNGPIKQSNDEMVPLTRPEKYDHIIHAEENCLLSYNGCYQDLMNSTIYITGSPCHNCLRMIIQKGIKNIVYSNSKLAVMQTDSEQKVCELMLSYSNKVNIKRVDNLKDILEVLNVTSNYIKEKNKKIQL